MNTWKKMLLCGIFEPIVPLFLVVILVLHRCKQKSPMVFAVQRREKNRKLFAERFADISGDDGCL